MMRYCILFLFLLVSGCIESEKGADNPAEPVVDDAALLDCLNRTSPGGFQDEDLEIRTRIVCRRCDITSLKGIDKFKNLTELYIPGNKIKDLSPLKSLKLVSLDLSDNGPQADYAVLGEIQTLEHLYLSDAGVPSVDFAGALKNLVKLDIRGNDLTQIDALRNLANLESLYMQNNLVRDLSPLKDLQNLSVIVFNKNCVKIDEIDEALVSELMKRTGLLRETICWRNLCYDDARCK